MLEIRWEAEDAEYCPGVLLRELRIKDRCIVLSSTNNFNSGLKINIRWVGDRQQLTR